MLNASTEKSDLIVAAALTSSMARKKEGVGSLDDVANCAECSFSLPAFGVALVEAERLRAGA